MVKIITKRHRDNYHNVDLIFVPTGRFQASVEPLGPTSVRKRSVTDNTTLIIKVRYRRARRQSIRN